MTLYLVIISLRANGIYFAANFLHYKTKLSSAIGFIHGLPEIAAMVLKARLFFINIKLLYIVYDLLFKAVQISHAAIQAFIDLCHKPFPKLRHTVRVALIN